MSKAEFMIPRPADTGRGVTRESGNQFKMTFMVYRAESGEELKWSAKFPLPHIGARITVTMNRIGAAEVVGYFKEGGFVGVMTKAINPPQWLKDQQNRERASANFASLPPWRKQGIGCQFGAEIALI